MGGGQYNPSDSRQTGINEYYDHAPRAISPAFTGFGDMLDGAIEAQNWLPAMHSVDGPRHHGRAESAHDHNISDDLEEPEDTDSDLNASGNSPEANVEPVPSVRRERPRLASALPSPSNQNEVKKVKACVRCRMQKVKASHIFTCMPESIGVFMATNSVR